MGYKLLKVALLLILTSLFNSCEKKDKNVSDEIKKLKKIQSERENTVLGNLKDCTKKPIKILNKDLTLYRHFKLNNFQNCKLTILFTHKIEHVAIMMLVV